MGKPTVSKFHEDLLDLIKNNRSIYNTSTIWLGGVSGPDGGTGGRPGGFIGKLKQTQVTYDTSEQATLSGSDSLLDNLNHIRYQIASVSGSIVTSFLELEDTPDTYFGHNGHYVTVSGNQLVFSPLSGSGVGDMTKAIYDTDDDGVVDNAEALGGVIATNVLKRQVTFIIEGDLSVETGVIRIYNQLGYTLTFSKFFIAVDTAPTGADIIVDLNKNGSTVFTNPSNRPQIAAGSNTGSTTTFDVSTWEADSYLTIDIDQVGSTTPGSNFTGHIVCY